MEFHSNELSSSTLEKLKDRLEKYLDKKYKVDREGMFRSATKKGIIKQLFNKGCTDRIIPMGDFDLYLSKESANKLFKSNKRTTVFVMVHIENCEIVADLKTKDGSPVKREVYL